MLLSEPKTSEVFQWVFNYITMSCEVFSSIILGNKKNNIKYYKRGTPQ